MPNNSNNSNKPCAPPQPTIPVAASGKTVISGPVLDRLIKEKMARTPECDGITALPVVKARDAARSNWRIPGYVGDVGLVPRCEAAMRDYLEFLAGQFDLADD